MEGHPFRDAPAQRPLVHSKMRPRMSRGGRFTAAFFTALIWNAICAWQLVAAYGAANSFYIFVVGVFSLMGLGIVVMAVYFFLALFNPTVELHASEDSPALGETLELSWRLGGKTRRVRELRITLEGYETAKYTQGTSTMTDIHMFAKIVVVATRSPHTIAEGMATVVIPADTMPTWSASHNRIHWKINVDGDVPWWPDIDDPFDIQIAPRGRARAKAA